MEKKQKPTQYVSIAFDPSTWGEIEIFRRFGQTTYKFSSHASAACNGVENNFRKSITLREVAQSISPKLVEDRKELEEKGYSSGKYGKQYTAIAESTLTALYSSIDCTRVVLKAIYPKARGLPDSTRKLFANAKAGKLDTAIPLSIREALSHAEWYATFRVLRDALTHSDTGFCHLDKDTNKVRYFHESLRPLGSKSYIDDFDTYLEETASLINKMLGIIFRELNKTLNDEEILQVCGVFDSRVYTRSVSVRAATDFHSGKCLAFTWFDLPENPTCPFRNKCGAYKARDKVEQE